MSKKTKKNIKVRDLKPKKDAKGGYQQQRAVQGPMQGSVQGSLQGSVQGPVQGSKSLG